MAMFKLLVLEAKKIIDQWETNTKAKGDGPYSLDFFNFNLVLLNGKGEVYWSSNALMRIKLMRNINHI